jgi:hypothetical protein
MIHVLAWLLLGDMGLDGGGITWRIGFGGAI